MSYLSAKATPDAAKLEGRSALVEGEFAFTHDDFRQIAEMLHADSGIALPDSKATLVYSRLAKRLRALGLESFRQYCAMVQDSQGIDERKRMLASLTTNVTRFFREPHHFDHLRRQVLPPLLEGARRGARVRLWSAGCSTGQEPYSIAMTVLELLPNAADYDIRILASDIDSDVIATARAGIYGEEALSQVPADRRARFFTAAGAGRQSVSDDMRELVAFRELNLIGHWPMKGKFNAIFCRNVVIYFQEDTQTQIWTRFVQYLVPGGSLYIGHSERLTGVGDRFDADGLTTYKLKQGARA